MQQVCRTTKAALIERKESKDRRQKERLKERAFKVRREVPVVRGDEATGPFPESPAFQTSNHDPLHATRKWIL